MDTKELVKKLDSLLRANIDAVNSDEQALKRIDLPDVRARIQRHHDDHQRHVDTLSRLIREHGGEPTLRPRRFRGFLTRGFTMITIQGFASVRSTSETEAALDAMEGNERLMCRVYADAVSWEVDETIHDVLCANYHDEREHLVYIQRRLEHKIEIDPYHPHRTGA
ncbi:MAG: DUF2383 domain-containing protein [Chitinivibrionales bacterium]|nr:DUF2383 domain-containing protein [Chitinivibrionales bacterium]